MSTNPFLFLLFMLQLFFPINSQKYCPSTSFPRVSCGSINESMPCEARGCCFDNESLPLCFFPLGKSNFSCPIWESQGHGFSDKNYSFLYKIFEANIDVNGWGAVCASKDNNTAIGSYYYHWARDAALVMKYFMYLNGNSLSKIEKSMVSYIENWVIPVEHSRKQSKIDPRVEPKFNIKEKTAFEGDWCRPQADATGLRATTLANFAKILLDNGKKEYVQNKLYPEIKYDLEWICDHWKEETCDVWEDERSDDFFWVRMAFRRGLIEGAKIADLLGDKESSKKYKELVDVISPTILQHYDKNAQMFTEENKIRQIDGATLTAYIENYADDDFINPLDPRIASTLEKTSKIFCDMYDVNKYDSLHGIPGVLHGRYVKDVYCGGNPWHITTGSAAKVFYKASLEAAKRAAKGSLPLSLLSSWAPLLPKGSLPSSPLKFCVSLLSSGDALLERMRSHALGDDLHLYEQIGARDGKQVNARDLTWSIGVVLTALKMRKEAEIEIRKIWNIEEI